MCLILFALGCHPRYPLVVAANRDEFHHRPSAALDFWVEHPELLAGRDIQAGGTWLGLSRNGRFAAVTNVRDANPAASYPLSRGALCVDWLTGNGDAPSFAASLNYTGYAPFNLLFGSMIKQIHYVSTTETRPALLSNSYYGLSNGALDNDWPKVQRGKQALASAIETGVDLDDLLGLLSNRDLAVDELLPDTGVGLYRERLLSAAFIVGPVYGTRSSIALRASVSGDVEARELRFDENGTVCGETTKNLPAFFSPNEPLTISQGKNAEHP